ncbi:rhamnogalacturonan acetylesterase [Dysgonomonas sp. 216]|uniref:rhamnogalacturonan acetylesterase n=1 Tax=Dysgonomonas sp. 216 TaxID=2302934 RepID=UPI00210551FB|nr:rhamnogalacturonan acetylesterase [Dysgonomonas sp. 216]
MQAGETRVDENAPILFLIGDSTVKNGRGDGSNGQWGWGSFFQQFIDSTRITVENFALGGRSSRSFFTEGLWDKVRPGLKKGDYVFMQFGHNDGGPLNTGRARASLKGVGNESQTVIMERTGGPETVYTYGHYLRLYIRQAKAMGAIPVVVSPTPNNRWNDGKIMRQDQAYAKWAKEVADQEGVSFIDLNKLSCDKCDAMGEEKARKLFMDTVHTNYEGAIMNCESLVEALKAMGDFSLNKYLIK